MAAEATHGQVASAAGSTSAAEAIIGSITLPARGQAWSLFSLMGQVVRQTATAAEMFGGYVGINSVSGDIEPDPAPSKFPVYGTGSFLGATAPVANGPLNVFPLDLKAAGKASLDLVAYQDIACTAAPIFSIGVSYGPQIPTRRPYRFCDRVRGTQTAVTPTQVGTITLSEKATRITGICGVIMQDGVLTTAEELTGYFYLDSDDVDLSPSQWLFNQVFGAGLSTLIGGGNAFPAMPHLVDIPVPGGARIDAYVVLTTAVTNAADVSIFLMYE